VDYFQPAIGGQVTNFEVYQSADRVSLISGSLSILQFQSVGKELEVMELHALSNLSTPPITQVNPDNFALSIPPGAQIDPAIISSPDGGTTKVPLVSVAGSTDQYRIEFPIKPGLTKYAIRYELRYDAASFVFRRQIRYPMSRIGIIIPKSMHLRLISPHSLHPVAGARGAPEQQFELDKLASNTTVAFALSGTGELARSFHPLQPGERLAPTMSAPQTKVTSPPVFPANRFPTSQHSRLTGYEAIVAVGILLLAGALVWFFVQRRKAAISKRQTLLL